MDHMAHSKNLLTKRCPLFPSYKYDEGFVILRIQELWTTMRVESVTSPKVEELPSQAADVVDHL